MPDIKSIAVTAAIAFGVWYLLETTRPAGAQSSIVNPANKTPAK